jgi:hypothetical protein
VSGVFRANGTGINLSESLLRLMEKELANSITSIPQIENNFDKFHQNAGLNHEICYNGIISQSVMGLVGCCASCSTMRPGCTLQAKEGVLV